MLYNLGRTSNFIANRLPPLTFSLLLHLDTPTLGHGEKVVQSESSPPKRQADCDAPIKEGVVLWRNWPYGLEGYQKQAGEKEMTHGGRL